LSSLNGVYGGPYNNACDGGASYCSVIVWFSRR